MKPEFIVSNNCPEGKLIKPGMKVTKVRIGIAYLLGEVEEIDPGMLFAFKVDELEPTNMAAVCFLAYIKSDLFVQRKKTIEELENESSGI